MRADFERITLYKSFGHRYGKNIRLPRKAFYGHFGFVEAFAVDFVRIFRFGNDFAPYEHSVVLLFVVNHYISPFVTYRKLLFIF